MIAHLQLCERGRSALLCPPHPCSLNGQHPRTLGGGFVEGGGKKKKKKRSQVGGPREGRGMVKPGVGGNWQAIAKATSCQDNAWGHRCPPIPTLMLIAFQCLWDNLSNNCFSCLNSALRAANKRDGTLFLTITAKLLYPELFWTHFIYLSM